MLPFAGERRSEFFEPAGATVRSVVSGVVGVAITQSVRVLAPVVVYVFAVTMAIFVGAVVLTLGYTLCTAWAAESERGPAGRSGSRRCSARVATSASAARSVAVEREEEVQRVPSEVGADAMPGDVVVMVHVVEECAA